MTKISDQSQKLYWHKAPGFHWTRSGANCFGRLLACDHYYVRNDVVYVDSTVDVLSDIFQHEHELIAAGYQLLEEKA